VAPQPPGTGCHLEEPVNGITLLELATHSATLEEAFFDLTRDETDYRAGRLAGSSKGI
jgi:hypothetical protein